MHTSFNPGPVIRNPHLQTIFSSLRIRNLGKYSILNQSREVIVDAGEGVRLLGYHSKTPLASSKGLVVFLHGWEGSTSSAYIISAAHAFLTRGYDVFRLNLRDHGGSHHLNKGLFHGALLDETFNAVRNVAAMAVAGPCFLVGYSLGGNFALRIAAKQGKMQPTFLRQVFAVSPVLDPQKSTAKLDRQYFIYRKYFLYKWKDSLRLKQALYREDYDFSRILRLKSCLAMTELMVTEYTRFKGLQDYFGRYTLNREWCESLTVPSYVIAAADDPLIEKEDFESLEGFPHLSVQIERYGGHCGFFSDFRFRCWAEEEIARKMEEVNPE